MRKPKTLEMAQLAILTAILLVLAFTPLGFLKIGLVEMTFLILPVAIGATVLGPTGGAILGTVFGLLSFAQCFTAPTPFSSLLISVDPIRTFILCVIPRLLCGMLSGWVFKLLSRYDKTKVVSFFVATLSTALLNTLFFVGGLILLFWKNATFYDTMVSWEMPVDTLWAFAVAIVGINGVIEAVVNCVLGGAIGKAVVKFVNKK